MEQWCGMFGAVATESGSPGATSLDVALPVWSENDGVRIDWWSDRVSEHLWVVELIELFCFTLLPFFPRRQFLELLASEKSKGLFFRRGC